MIPAARPYFDAAGIDTILCSVGSSLKSGMLTNGPIVRKYEVALARVMGVHGVVAVSSGTAALEAILRALSVSGTKALVSTNTYPATVWATLRAGLDVEFVDIDRDTLAMDVQSCLARIRGDTKVVIVTHIGGLISPSMPDFARICQERGLHLVEDCAHAIGATLFGRPAGSFGIAGAYSFFPTKVLTAVEGGAVVSNGDAGLLERVTLLRDQGKDPSNPDDHLLQGYNWRLSELHAAVGLQQLSQIQEILNSRKCIACVYDRLLADVPGIAPLRIPHGTVTNYYKYIVLLDRDFEMKTLTTILCRRGVQLSGGVYHRLCHEQSVLRAKHSARLPNAEWFARHHICLPIYPSLTTEDAERVVGELRQALEELPGG